jgi:hypothetical protein
VASSWREKFFSLRNLLIASIAIEFLSINVVFATNIRLFPKIWEKTNIRDKNGA